MANIVISSININLPCPGLASKKRLSQLSEKRITVKAREILRNHFVSHNVTVSCSALYQNQSWSGTCSINGMTHQFQIL